MEIRAFRDRLFAKKPALIWRFRQAGAVKSLAASDDPAAVDPLLDALVSGHRLSPRILAVLAAVEDPVRVERMWKRWASKREKAVGELLAGAKRLPADPALRVLAALKIGAAGRIPLDAQGAQVVVHYARDAEAQVRASCDAWVERARASAPDLHLSTVLRLRRFDRVGADRAALARVAARVRAEPGLADDVAAWVQQLPADARLAAVLKIGGADLPKTREQAFALVPFFRDADPDVRAGAERYLEGLGDPTLAAPVRLKLGRAESIATDPKTARAVLDSFTDADAEVRAGAKAYARLLPDETGVNDALYDLWLRTEAAEIADLLSGDRRLPSSPAKEALLHLTSGHVDRYHAMGDPNGQIFRDAYAMASRGLRAKLNDVAMKSRDVRLIDLYASTVGSAEVAIKPVLDARMAAGDEDGLFEALRPLGIGDLLDLCERWRETGRRPKEATRRRAVDLAVAALERLGGNVELDPPPELPDGLVDFFQFWEEQNLDAAALRDRLKAEDPFVRAGAAWAVSRRGALPAGLSDKMASSDDWPERFVARLVDAKHVAPKDEHVRFTSLFHDVVSEAVLSATAGGSPAENQRLRQVVGDGRQRAGRAAALERELAQILLAFQDAFLGGLVTVHADDAAREKEAVRIEGDVAPDDMRFDR